MYNNKEPLKIIGELKSQKNGVEFTFIFEYFYEYKDYLEGMGYIFRIWNETISSNDYFSFQLREMENGTDLKVVDLYPDREKNYIGKGISISIILKSKEIFNKRIISSSNKRKSHPGEFNTREAIEKVWDRMVLLGLAKYDSDNDYYFVL